MTQLNSPIESLPKIQKPLVAALKKLGIKSLRDLILWLPYRYLDFSITKSIRDLKPGEAVSVKAKIKTISSRFSFRGHMSLAEAIVSDDMGSLKVVWFNQPYLARSLKAGDEVFLAGTPEYYNFSLQMTNPIYEKASDLAYRQAGFPVHTSRLVPLYHLKAGMYPKTFRNLIAGVIGLADELRETLPDKIIAGQNLLTLPQTIRASHFPTSSADVDAAKKRLAFEEIFLNQLLAQKHKLELAKKQAFAIKFNQNLIKAFVDSLPFQLTADQKRASWDILQDLEKPLPMNRLLEGDVGSGKTLVALIAALQTESAGLQAVLLAPTEILASQHYKTIHGLLCQAPLNFNTRCALITQNFSLLNNKETKKSKITDLIATGMPGLYIGTHALLQKNISFKNLALVIIDEQHRFGVEQRAELMKTDGKVPHLLSLSATPIPRTLQLAVYGELDISRIKNKPQGRKPIVTKLVTADNRAKAYKFISDQINAGRQAFVITPLVDESDKLGVKAATSEVKNLQKIFPSFAIGLMHGRLKGTEKERVMKDFLDNRINILVSTSVVEVGVDIPNASVMMIEAAERFGLAQLHQFRGRVGRAEHQSYCFLFSSLAPPRSSPPGTGGVSPFDGDGVVDKKQNETQERLEAFTKTQDGFQLAELDLKQRGFGQIYGQAQSGWDYKYFSPAYTSLIAPARQEALALLNDDLNLEKYPRLKEKLKDKIVHFE